MLERVLHLLHQRTQSMGVHWLTPDIAIGSAASSDEWQALYGSGVRAVVDLRRMPEDLGAVVREKGMRYLRLCPDVTLVPSAEELQIVTGWVLERIAEDGRVLVHDAHARFNDGLVAVAALIKSGMPAHLALLALRRAAPAYALDTEQNAQLVRFAAAQPAASGTGVDEQPSP